MKIVRIINFVENDNLHIKTMTIPVYFVILNKNTSFGLLLDVIVLNLSCKFHFLLQIILCSHAISMKKGTCCSEHYTLIMNICVPFMQ